MVSLSGFVCHWLFQLVYGANAYRATNDSTSPSTAGPSTSEITRTERGCRGEMEQPAHTFSLQLSGGCCSSAVPLRILIHADRPSTKPNCCDHFWPLRDKDVAMNRYLGRVNRELKNLFRMTNASRGISAITPAHVDVASTAALLAS